MEWSHWYWIPIVCVTLFFLSGTIISGIKYRRYFKNRNIRPSIQSASREMYQIVGAKNAATNTAKESFVRSIRNGEASSNSDIPGGASSESRRDRLTAKRNSIANYDKKTYDALTKDIIEFKKMLAETTSKQSWARQLIDTSSEQKIKINHINILKDILRQKIEYSTAIKNNYYTNFNHEILKRKLDE